MTSTDLSLLYGGRDILELFEIPTEAKNEVADGLWSCSRKEVYRKDDFAVVMSITDTKESSYLDGPATRK